MKHILDNLVDDRGDGAHPEEVEGREKGPGETTERLSPSHDHETDGLQRKKTEGECATMRDLEEEEEYKSTYILGEKRIALGDHAQASEEGCHHPRSASLRLCEGARKRSKQQ